jgi:outer membrane receptor protein involved in Fe transport
MTHEFRVNSPSEKAFRLTAGLFMQIQTDKVGADYEVQGTGSVDPANFIWATPFPGTDTVFLTRVKRKDRDYAMFAQAEYDIAPTLTAIAGIRGFIAHNTVYGFSGTTGSGIDACIPDLPAPDGAPCTNADKKQVESGVIWRGGLKWQATPDIMFYGTVSRGYRPGGNNRRVGVDPFKSDTLDNYEIGWKTQFGRIYFNGAAFYEKWKDLQFGLVPAGQNGVTNTYNAGNARIYGIEGDVAARFGGLTLSASATYVDAKLTTDFCEVDPITKNIVCNPGTPPAAPKGTRLPVMPKFKGTAAARYEFPVGEMSKAFVQASVSHQGGTRSFLTDADFAAFGTTKPFTTADFSAGIHWEKWHLEAFIQNAFDSRGQISLNTACSPQFCGIGSRVYPTKPQLFGIKAGYDF